MGSKQIKDMGTGMDMDTGMDMGMGMGMGTTKKTGQTSLGTKGCHPCPKNLVKREGGSGESWMSGLSTVSNIRLVARGQRGGKKESFFIHTKAF